MRKNHKENKQMQVSHGEKGCFLFEEPDVLTRVHGDVSWHTYDESDLLHLASLEFVLGP